LAGASIQAETGDSWTSWRARARTLACLVALALLAGCSAKPIVPSNEFPKPVLRKIPVAVGLYMDDAFLNYVHHDKPAAGVVQDVSVGPASRAIFSEFLSAQFATLVTVQQAPGAQSETPGVQAVLQPTVQDVQIASPKAEKDQFHEAWIKYRLRLLTPQGQEITAWDLAAYGKQRGAKVGGTNSGLTAAVREAMRDAAAGMALIFRDGNAFRERLAAPLPPPQAAATTP
jgi:hypothetical protein